MFFDLLKKYVFIALVVLTSIVSISWALVHIAPYFVETTSVETSSDKATKKAPIVNITVFIHGTVGSTFNIFNPWHLAAEEEVDVQTFGVRTVKKYRNQSIMQYDQILGKEGFCEVCSHCYNLPDVALSMHYSSELETWHAARHLIPAYHAVARQNKNLPDVHKTVVFGWSGLLHARARKEAGYELYQKLSDYIEALTKEYGAKPTITLVTHSHGGNIALWLAAAEQEFKRGLLIDCLCMYGTPMHKEMGAYIESPMFKTMVLFHSQGDGIQLRDYFSTKSKKSYQKMSEIGDCKTCTEQCPGCKRYDVCCVVNGSFKAVTHTNMWMAGRSTPVFACMDPLPLFVLTPVFLQALENQNVPLLCEAHLICNDQGFSLKFYDPKTGKLVHEPYKNDQSVPQVLQEWGTKMKQEWQLPDDKGRHPFFNRKNWKAFKNMVWGPKEA